jgi:hypothetical protein
VDKEEGRQGYLSACDLPENTRGEVMGEVGEPASSARGRGVMGGRGGARRGEDSWSWSGAGGDERWRERGCGTSSGVPEHRGGSCGRCLLLEAVFVIEWSGAAISAGASS